MDQQLIGIVALVSFVLLLTGMIFVIVGAVLRRTRAARKRLQAQITAHQIAEGKFTARNIKEWITVGQYDIYIHQVVEQLDGTERIVCAEVEYRNQSGQQNLSCRRNQWHLYGKDGYSYEAESVAGARHLYSDKHYFGSDRFINAGMHVRGWLAFKVPQEAQIIILQFMTAYVGTKTADIHIEHVIETAPASTTQKSVDHVAAQTVKGCFLSAVMQHFQYLLTDYGFEIKMVDLSRHPPESEERVEFESPTIRVSIVNNQRAADVIIYRMQDDRYRYFLHMLQIREYHLLSEAAKQVTCSLDPQDTAAAETLHQAAGSRSPRLPSESAFQYLDSQLAEYSKWLREYAEPFLRGDTAQWLAIYEYDVSSSRAAYIRSGKEEFVRTVPDNKDERRSIFQNRFDYLEKLREEYGKA